MRTLHAIVLAGGSGKRLAAVTERMAGRPTPKQFCAFRGCRTLLQETIERLSPLVPDHRTVVVAREKHRDLVRDQLEPFPTVAVLSQPADRGTTPALLWAVVHVLARDPEALVLLTPSDHGVRDEQAYVRGLAAARDAVEAASAVLLGVEAEPNGDFGWIVPGEELRPGVRTVERFVEKPGRVEAEGLRGRGALCSTMVLVARARELLAMIERARPGLVALFEPLPALPQAASALHLERVYAMVEPSDFSRDILANAADLAVVRWPEALGWTDLGTPDRLAKWLAAEAALVG